MRFLEFLFENNAENLNEAGANADPKKNDCHEILTAYLCTKRISDLDALEKVTGADNILKELQAIYNDVKNSNKIIGAAEEETKKLEANMSDEQKQMLADLDKMFPPSKLEDCDD